MLPEQQQRILGYFIEEAKDHLNTIEQGLLNLQDTLKDSELVNEIFRAAHSVKGGAAMLGLDSIQRTAHRLEDFFKVLKESPVQVDQQLESLFLRVFDTLKELIEQLESATLTEDTASNLMSEVEPVFTAVEQHLEALVNQINGGQLEIATKQVPATSTPAAVTVTATSAESAFRPATYFSVFQTEVLQQLRQMLQLFKQAETPQTRQQLQDCCQQLIELGEQYDLSGWCTLCETAAGAIADEKNSYHTLAPIVIKELKHCQNLVLTGRAGEIKTCEQLQALAVATFLDSWEDADMSSGKTINLPTSNVSEVADSLLPASEPLDFLNLDSSELQEAASANDGDRLLADTSAFDSLFSDIDSDNSPSTEDTDFSNMFADLEASEPTASMPETNLSNFWVEESEATADLGFELEDFAVESAEELFDDLSETLEFLPVDAEAVPASDTAYELFSTDEFDLTVDTIETDLSSPAAEENEPNLDLMFDELANFPADESLENASDLATAFNLDTEAELDQLVTLEPGNDAAATTNFDLEAEADFGELEALLAEEVVVTTEVSANSTVDLNTPIAETVVPTTELATNDTVEQLSVADKQPEAVSPAKAAATPNRRPAFEQMMRVPVKQLDNIGNLVGELVVYRNSLEDDQEKLRQFLDNLLNQVHNLGDVGARMQELYERSLLEASLLSRQSPRPETADAVDSDSQRHATGMDFDALEMDRFTAFHTLAQEIIELIVRVRESSSDIEFVTDENDRVARQFRQVTTQLQEGLTRSRMIPFGQMADRLPRAVRDISLKCGKQAELQIEGQDTLIDKGILEQLYDPMTHLVNNAITHGIEFPADRIAKGKSPVGQITVRAFHQGNQTVISISDDGAGVDTEKVKAKAIQKGLITSETASTMSRLEAYNLLFHAGFSTKEQVDEFSGRGVGMDVVLTSLSQIRGTINTDSTLGKGTTFTIRLPLTLSICKALCCISDKARIAFPMDGVEQMLDIPVEAVIINEAGQPCISWRDSLLPFRHLKELITYNRQLSRSNIFGGNREDNLISIIVLRSADTFIALQVDQVLGEQEIVIKQFEAPASKPIGIAGATVMGDGRIMPIADVLELIDISTGRIRRDMLSSAAQMPSIATARAKTEPMVLIVDDSITVRELLSMTFTNAGYRVEQARDGQEAWDKLRDGLPCNLVFCDIEMPRMDGLELLSRMQKDPQLCELPIAMLTSRGSERHRQMAVQLGASGYFTKPYLEEALLDAAQRMLRGEVLVAISSHT